MKYYIIAGEKSGDLHGSNLMKSLLEKDSSAEFRFWGGDHMQSVGGNMIMHYRELAVMGFWEVLTNVQRIAQFLSQCKEDISKYKPDVVILIDFAGFNLRIAKFAKQAGFKVFYYISPKIWAWNTSRAWKVKKYVDRMFVILPFEKEFYKKFEWEVDYVGNPVVDAVSSFQHDKKLIEELNHLSKDWIAILPGSRTQELKQVIPTLSNLIQRNPHYNFLVAKVDSVAGDLYEQFSGLPNVRLVVEKAYDVLSIAKAAVVTSGTATLETALFNVPQVVVYKAGSISYLIGKAVVKVPYISLVNLIAGKEVVKELIQNDFNLERLETELKNVLLDKQHRSHILEGYRMISEKLGKDKASKQAAELMVDYLSG